MFHKMIFPALLLWIFSFWLSHADYKADEEGRNIAQKYIDENRDGFFWKDNTPTLWEWTPFFMEKETPSYIEYQVHCSSTPNCWFIIVNVDGDDVEIPALSHSDTPPSIILAQKSKTRIDALQFYYFSPLSLFARNTLDESIFAVDPQIDPRESDFDPKLGDKKIQEMIESQRKNLPSIFQSYLQAITEYKQSDDFQTWKQNIWQPVENMNIPEYIPTGNTQDIGSMRYLKGLYDFETCHSIVPCYRQFWYLYENDTKVCWSGCTPVAAAIVYAYHQRNDYPWLSSSPLPMINEEYYQPTRDLIDDLRGYMETFCGDITGDDDTNIHPWSTYWHKIWRGIQYAWYHGYTDAYPTNIPIWWTVDIPTLFNDIKWFIVAGNPIIMSVKNPNVVAGHSVVVYGYAIDTSNWNYSIVLNAGWWDDNFSHEVINLSGFSFSNSHYSTITRLTLFNMQ